VLLGFIGEGAAAGARGGDFFEEIEFSFEADQTAIEVTVGVGEIFDLLGQAIHVVFYQYYFADGVVRVTGPAHLPFFRCLRIRST
jgi:hypothetical protein